SGLNSQAGQCLSISVTGAVTTQSCTTGGFAYLFTNLNSFGTSTAATTTSILTQGVFFSSSTVAASQFPYASSTAFTTGSLFATGATTTSLAVTNVTNALLFANAQGSVTATTSIGTNFLPTL